MCRLETYHQSMLWFSKWLKSMDIKSSLSTAPIMNEVFRGGTTDICQSCRRAKHFDKLESCVLTEIFLWWCVHDSRTSRKTVRVTKMLYTNLGACFHSLLLLQCFTIVCCCDTVAVGNFTNCTKTLCCMFLGIVISFWYTFVATQLYSPPAILTIFI